MNPRYYLITTALVFFFTFNHAQRYLSEVFDQVDTLTLTYAEKDKESLDLDLYLPKGDTLSKKPLLLYVHGGGFSGGVRDDKNTKIFCKTLAKKGYAVASMSYRLVMKGQSFSCDQPSPNKIKTFQSVVQDIRDATAFLLKNQENYKIDKEHIVLAGSSAGAEAIVHAAYWKNDNLPEGTTTLPDGFSYAGIISMAGAIVDLKLINNNSALPSLFFHGTCDNLVPYATAPHHYCEPIEVGYLILHGGKSMADRLKHLGKPYSLFSSCNGDHSWASRPMVSEINTIVDFLHHDVIMKKFRQIHYVIEEEGSCDYFEAPFNYCK